MNTARDVDCGAAISTLGALRLRYSCVGTNSYVHLIARCSESGAGTTLETTARLVVQGWSFGTMPPAARGGSAGGRTTIGVAATLPNRFISASP